MRFGLLLWEPAFLKFFFPWIWANFLIRKPVLAAKLSYWPHINSIFFISEVHSFNYSLLFVGEYVYASNFRYTFAMARFLFLTFMAFNLILRIIYYNQIHKKLKYIMFSRYICARGRTGNLIIFKYSTSWLKRLQWLNVHSLLSSWCVYKNILFFFMARTRTFGLSGYSYLWNEWYKIYCTMAEICFEVPFNILNISADRLYGLDADPLAW